MNPVEEYLMEKQALGPEARAAIALGAISAGTTAVAAVGTAQLQSGIQSAQDTVSRSIAFKRMMRDNPELNKMDGKKARRYFNTMYNTSPELAKDPFAAGSWVKKIEDYDYVDPQSLNVLAQTGDKLRQRRSQHLMPAFQIAQTGVQTGMGEYGRLQDQAFKIRQDELKSKRDLRQNLVRDVTREGIGLGKDLLRGHQSKQERLEQQQFEAGKERRQAAIKRWELEQSPKAYGVGGKGGLSMAEYRKMYAQGREAEKRFPQGDSFIGPLRSSDRRDMKRIRKAPAPFPGSFEYGLPPHGGSVEGSIYRQGSETVGPSAFEQLKDAIASKLGRK